MATAPVTTLTLMMTVMAGATLMSRLVSVRNGILEFYQALTLTVITVYPLHIQQESYLHQTLLDTSMK